MLLGTLFGSIVACAPRDPSVGGPGGRPNRVHGSARAVPRSTPNDAATAPRDAVSDDAGASRIDGSFVPADARTAHDASASDAGVLRRRLSVLTQHNDLARTGANLFEEVLTVESVRSSRFGKVATRAVDDQVYAQPLVVTGVDMPGLGVRNLLVVATVNDSVYAFDADDASVTEPLWKRSFLSSGVVPPRNTDMTGACSGHYVDYSGNIGIAGTPVVDPDTLTLFLVARTKESGAFYQRLHALSLVDGSERAGSPVLVYATVSAGAGMPSVGFNPLHENQRAGLALVDGTVYVGWGGHCDWPPFYGWLMGYDAATLEQVRVYNAAPTGDSAGIWQGGQAPSADEHDLFVVTGNGKVGTAGNPRDVLNRGQSIVRLRPTQASLDVVTWFTPYDYPVSNTADTDLGTSGLLLVPDTRFGVSGSKGGFMYVVNRDDMGGLTSSNSGDDNIVQYIDVHHPSRIYGSPVFWRGPDRAFLYVWSEDDQLKAFPLVSTSTTPGSSPFDVANVLRSAVSLPGMPGGLLSISANGSTRGSGIVWAARDVSGNANQRVLPGMLQAFDAETLEEIWNNQTDKARDDCGNFAKFSYPTIANGKVYLPTFSNQVCVYGSIQ